MGYVKEEGLGSGARAKTAVMKIKMGRERGKGEVGVSGRSARRTAEAGVGPRTKEDRRERKGCSGIDDGVGDPV